jgi:hypothetical protein
MHARRRYLAALGMTCIAGSAFACASTGDAVPADLDAGMGMDAGDAAPINAPSAVGISLFGSTCMPGAPKVDWSPMRRISRVEYNNMVRDLLGDTTQPANGFPPESPLTSGVNFQTNTYAGVSALIVQDYMQAAETLAETAVKDTNNLNNNVLALAGCTDHTDACAQQFISNWGNRAFRGQLDSTESAALFQLYSDVKAQFNDWTAGVQAVITAVLESPRFLYVMEFGSGSPMGNVVPLSPYETAARLALFLWRSVPDDVLMTAAAQGNLSTPDQIAQQASRMLADSKKRAKDALDDFTTQWMQLQATATQGKDSQFTWPPMAGEAMKQETLINFSELVLTKNGGLAELLTSPSSYINDYLGTVYGSSVDKTTKGVPVIDSALGNSTTFYLTQLSNRAGILTNGSVLSTQSHTTLPSFVLRGKLVRENVLCDPIAPPPVNANIGPAPTSVPDGGTTRSTLEAHFANPSCLRCHQYMDPIGLGFGHFDATGAYQANDVNGFTDAGVPPGGWPAIDVSGQVVAMNPGEFSATFDGAVDLVTQLSAATQTRQCFALQEFRYALSRVETASDACSAQQFYSAFSSGNFNIQQLLIAIVQSDAFRYRSVETAGSACQ